MLRSLRKDGGFIPNTDCGKISRRWRALRRPSSKIVLSNSWTRRCAGLGAPEYGLAVTLQRPLYAEAVGPARRRERQFGPTMPRSAAGGSRPNQARRSTFAGTRLRPDGGCQSSCLKRMIGDAIHNVAPYLCGGLMGVLMFGWDG